MSKEPEVQNQPPMWTNIITLAGLLITAFSLLLLVTFWLFDIFTSDSSSSNYANIVGYLIIPSGLVFGLTLCPIGILIRRWRSRHGAAQHISAQHAIMFLMISFFVTLPVLGIAGYKGYHYTESAEFCGTICHTVMEPHYVAYLDSPHARTQCAGCHIGPGAEFLVKAKLNGTRQLFAVAFDTFSRPIPTAIKHLRPAQETCEHCHWPEQFFGSQLKTIVRYSPNEQNTRHESEIVIKVGGKNTNMRRSEGIHMHMLNHVRYVAADETLQEIPWIEYIDEDGKTTVYRSDGKAATDPPPTGHVRKLDCIDCHNRVGHVMRSPAETVDQFLDNDDIDDSLPFIKREAVAAIAKPQPDINTAVDEIAKTINAFYKTNYPEIAANQQDDIDRSIQTLQDIYRRNNFPAMKANWATYPNNIGHLESPGCFRCHDGLHVNAEEQAITSQCSTCHTFLNRKVGTNVIIEGDFKHDLKIHENWDDLGPHRNMRCDQCHTGDGFAWGENSVSERCGDCHDSGRWLEDQGKIMFRPMTAPAE